MSHIKNNKIQHMSDLQVILTSNYLLKFIIIINIKLNAMNSHSYCSTV